MKIRNRIGGKSIAWKCLPAIVLTLLLMQGSVWAQTLVNRYSFSGTNNTAATDNFGFGDINVGATIVDSVGGPTWNGTLPNGGIFTADGLELTNDAYLASGTNNTADAQYVLLPSGILQNYTAVTIDTWATFGTLPGACFLWGFGNTDSGGAGENYIFCQPENGRIAITAVDPGYDGEEGCTGGGNWSDLTMHVTAVFNPPLGYEELYTNGVLVARNTGITDPMSAVSGVESYLGRSLYTPDSVMDMTFTEFRIWNGALNGLQVAGADANGSATTNISYGTVTGIQLTLPFYQMTEGTFESAAVAATASGISSSPDISFFATYKSSNTNILATTSSNSVISAVGQGSAQIIASYGGISATQTVTVVQPASALAHRYTFSQADNGAGNVGVLVPDSVGGSAWDATLPEGATFTNDMVELASGNSEFVQLPEGIISNYTAVTIDTWVTFPDALPGNCFLFGFGNTDSGGAGEDYIYMQPSSGHIGITGADPGWQGPEDQAGTYGNLSYHTNLHVTAVFNPPAGWIAVYTNGVLAGKNTAVTWAMNQVASINNYIGRSLYTGDSYMDVNVQEYRIYKGALTSQGVAIADAAGPNSVPAAVTNFSSSLQSLTISAPSAIQCLQAAPVKLFANYAGLTNWDLIGNSVIAPAGLVVGVSDTNVLTYSSSSGEITGVNPGIAQVVTIYQGITNTASVTVTQAVPILVHRYSFGSMGTVATGGTATDSVGGADGTLYGAATISGGTLNIPNTAQTAPAPDYLLLPPTILTNGAVGIGTNYNYPVVTVETWASFGAAQGYWAALFDFGWTDSGGLGAYDIHVGQLGGSTIFGISDSDNANTDYQYGQYGSLAGQTNIHIVAIFNPPAGYLAYFTNGVLCKVDNSISISMAGVWPVVNKIGADLWPDPGMRGTVSEFRIYSGALSPADVASTQALGPTALLGSTGVTVTATASGGNVILSWPASGGLYTVLSRSSLNSGAWTTNTSATPVLNGSTYQVTLPATSGSQFFRLVQ
jgi:hypothetical protein